MKTIQPIYVVYASETGHAKAAAWDTACLLLHLKIPCSLLCINQFWLDTQDNTLNSFSRPTRCTVVFVISTTGQGEVPSDMRHFWKFLLSINPSFNFTLWSFSVFGLGDSRYQEYNFAARKLRIRLKQLGATEFYRIGLGDDQHNLGFQAELYPWLHGMLEAIIKQPIPSSIWEEFHTALIPPKYKVREVNLQESLNPSHPFNGIHSRDSFSLTSQNSNQDCFEAVVTTNTRMTCENHPHVVHRLRLAIPLAKQFLPGSCLTVYPQNCEEKVTYFIKEILHRDPEDLLIFSENPLYPFHTSSDGPYSAEHYFKHQLGKPMRFFDAIKYYFDIASLPTQYTLQILAYFCCDGLMKDKLLQVSQRNAEGCELFNEFIQLELHSVSDVLWDFNICIERLSLDYLFSILPLMEPRKYSIASTPFWYSPKLWWCLGGARLLWKCPLAIIGATPLLFHKVLLSTLTLHKEGKSLENLKTPLQKAQFLVDQLAQRHCVNLWNNCSSQSSEENGEQYIDLCVGLGRRTTPSRRIIEGLCSSYLIKAPIGVKIFCRLESKAILDIQRLEASPMLFFATGTGVAPIRALVQRRYMSWKRFLICHPYNKPVNKWSPLLVFLGFRHFLKDFLFINDWSFFSSNVTLFPRCFLLNATMPSFTSSWSCSTSVAFSQQSEDKKMYIQDALLEKAHEVRQLFSKEQQNNTENQVAIVISGRSHPMPGQVLQYLTSLLSQNSDSLDSVKKKMNKKKQQGLLVFETWGV